MPNSEDPKKAFRDGFDALIDSGIGDGRLTDEQGLIIDLTHQHLLNNGMSSNEAALQLGRLVGGAIRGNQYTHKREFGDTNGTSANLNDNPGLNKLLQDTGREPEEILYV